ncbi:MAG: PaaX family transcriptional regulator C-terminal domain-containing protein [Vicinamibacterales bacterium]
MSRATTAPRGRWPPACGPRARGRRLRALRGRVPSGAGGLDAGRPLTDLDALATRVLLVHAFRRIVLRDPLLPAAILPRDWPGAEARALCAEVYTAVLPASERWLDAHGRAAPGIALPPAEGLAARFRP